jgi:hypothetical protein
LAALLVIGAALAWPLWYLVNTLTPSARVASPG